MKQQILQILKRLRKPSVLLSIVSQIVAILLMFGFNINQSNVMTIASLMCTLLVTIGILSNPDAPTKGDSSDMKICSKTGKLEKHVLIKEQWICTECGAAHTPECKQYFSVSAINEKTDNA